MNLVTAIRPDRIGVILVALALLAACGQEDRKKPTTQVAARVNSEEITVHQINSALARSPNIAPEAAAEAKRQVLDRLIDQQLAVQQAVHKKLDRTPRVQQMLESARSEILARAYLEQVVARQPKPADDEVKRYYAEHPELFAQRRVFQMEEIVVAAGTVSAADLRDRAAKSRSLKEVADWLQSRGVSFVPNRGVRAAEQVPLELLPTLQKARDGETLVVEGKDNLHLIRVVASKSEPVEEATAAPRIGQFLANRRASEAIAEELKQLKAGAQIEYAGEFASLAGAEQAGKADQAAKAGEERERERAEVQARSEETTKARLAMEAKARLEAEEKARSATSTAAPLSPEAIRKGVR